jgi:hypothetical protein
VDQLAALVLFGWHPPASTYLIKHPGSFLYELLPSSSLLGSVLGILPSRSIDTGIGVSTRSAARSSAVLGNGTPMRTESKAELSTCAS